MDSENSLEYAVFNRWLIHTEEGCAYFCADWFLTARAKKGLSDKQEKALNDFETAIKNYTFKRLPCSAGFCKVRFISVDQFLMLKKFLIYTEVSYYMLESLILDLCCHVANEQLKKDLLNFLANYTTVKVWNIYRCNKDSTGNDDLNEYISAEVLHDQMPRFTVNLLLSYINQDDWSQKYGKDVKPIKTISGKLHIHQKAASFFYVGCIYIMGKELEVDIDN